MGELGDDVVEGEVVDLDEIAELAVGSGRSPAAHEAWRSLHTMTTARLA